MSSKLLPAVVLHVRECIDAGELALALEELCAYVGEADRRFDPVQLRTVEQLAPRSESSQVGGLTPRAIRPLNNHALERTGRAERSLYSRDGRARPAVYEQAVVKCERAESRGLIPTVYSASLHWHAGRRHFSFCGADLTRSSDVARSTRINRHASRPGPRGSATVQSRSNSTLDLFFLSPSEDRRPAYASGVFRRGDG